MASLLPCWAKSAAKASRPLHFKQFEVRNVVGISRLGQMTALLCTLVISPYVWGVVFGWLAIRAQGLDAEPFSNIV